MRADLLERYRSLALPTTRDEHWRFTNLEGFDPDAWTADASSAVAVPSMLDLDVAAAATIDESGISVSEVSAAGVRFEALTDDLAAKPYESLTPDELDDLVATLDPLATLLLAAQDS